MPILANLMGVYGMSDQKPGRKLIPEKGKQAWEEVDLDDEKSQFCSCWHEAENVPKRG